MASPKAPVSRRPFHHLFFLGMSLQVPLMMSILFRTEEESLVPEIAHLYKG